MKRKKIIEHAFNPIKLTEETSENGEMKWIISGSFTMAGKPNKNRRIYPIDIMDNAINMLKPKIAQRRIKIGLDHPMWESQLSKTAAILLEVTNIQSDGFAYYKAQIIDTDAGKQLKEILKAGAMVGVSTRGYGSSKCAEWPGHEGEFEIIKDDFELKGFEFVDDPSVCETEEMMKLETTQRSQEMKTFEELKKAYPDIISSFEEEVKKEKAKLEESVETLESKMTESEKKLSKIVDSLKEAFKDKFVVIEESAQVKEKVTLIENKDKELSTLKEEVESLKKEQSKFKLEAEKLEKEKAIADLKAKDPDYFTVETLVKHFENCKTAEEVQKVYENGKALWEAIKKESTPANPKTKTPDKQVAEEVKARFESKNGERVNCGLNPFTMEQFVEFEKQFEG